METRWLWESGPWVPCESWALVDAERGEEEGEGLQGGREEGGRMRGEVVDR